MNQAQCLDKFLTQVELGVVSCEKSALETREGLFHDL